MEKILFRQQQITKRFFRTIQTGRCVKIYKKNINWLIVWSFGTDSIFFFIKMKMNIKNI
jgi:hypothetical protein